eukprot:133044_1
MTTASSYNHRIVQLRCCLASTQTCIQIKLPSPNNWTLNLISIVNRIPKKFKLLQDLHESEWTFSITNTVIDKRDPIQFGQLLSSTPPIATIEIVKCTNMSNSKNKPDIELHRKYLLNINYKSSSLTWTPPNPYTDDDVEWNDNYNKLLHKISTHFNADMNQFKLSDDDQCDVSDGYDLNAIWKCLVNQNEEEIANIHLLSKTIITTNEMKEEKLHVSYGNINEKRDLSVTWNHLLNCINHEMWPKLSSVIKAMIENDDNKDVVVSNTYDLSDNCIDNVIDKLRKKRYLPSEECQYLRKLIIRAREFNLGTKFEYNIDQHERDDKDFYFKMRRLNRTLLNDIFEYHRIFTFSNFNFREYNIADYRNDIIKQGKVVLGEHFVLTYLSNIQFDERFSLYPKYLVYDDMFRVFDYHFGV